MLIKRLLLIAGLLTLAACTQTPTDPSAIFAQPDSVQHPPRR